MLAQAIARAARRCPTRSRERVHLVALPMDDVEENAAIVNALQRRADVVVQKSLAEGFGLTVAEAMWKARPGRGQPDRRHPGPDRRRRDADCCSTTRATSPPTAPRSAALLDDPARAEAMGREAKERVRRRFLGTRTLIQSIELYERHIRQAQEGAGA